MSQQPEITGVDYRDLIHTAFRETGDSVPNGWFLFRIAGGTAGQDAYRSWVTGDTLPQIDNSAVLFKALNDRLEELGKERTLPELPFPTFPPNRGNPLRGDATYKAWCNQTLTDLLERVAS